jgi:CRISPR system Cascade subunit CasB
MSKNIITETIREHVCKKINLLKESESFEKAALARLRRAAGKKPGEAPEVLDVTFVDLSECTRRYKGAPSKAAWVEWTEWAIHVSLTLFAIHYQGNTGSIEKVSKSCISFGTAAGRLVDPTRANEQAVKRRFDAAVTSRGIKEFSHHARGLVKLMKASAIPMDYPEFAKQLYCYQNPDQRTRVVMDWGRDFWSVVADGQSQENKSDKSQRKNETEGANHEQ